MSEQVGIIEAFKSYKGLLSVETLTRRLVWEWEADPPMWAVWDGRNKILRTESETEAVRVLLEG